MKHHMIEKQDENVTESDIEALELFLGSTACSNGTMINKLDLRKYFAIIALTVLTSSQSLLIVWSKRAGKYEHSVTTADFLVEVLKCALSLVALFKIWRSDGITQDNKLSTSFDEVSVYSIPAALYLIKNLLQYSIFAYVDARMYQILSNLNIISTGVLYSLILKRKLTQGQWIAFILLYVGYTGSQLDASDSVRNIPPQGWVMVIVMALISGFGGVQTEAILKKRPSRNINVQNFWLSIFGVIFTLIAIYDNDFDELISKGFFHGYSFITLCMILNHALSRIAMSMVLKYANNIVMVYSTRVAITIADILSKFLFGLNLNMEFLACFPLVFISAVFYRTVESKWCYQPLFT
ncbi:CMP-sialic acid transporter 4 [Platanthera guangdongensis]|uniref:CMP-sialic acid transporter 4 n=1 Tax=Platanthera guangdongensis TaxID=2320717 RepID=A0ABR2LLR5_9ASPA